jgi:uncharacterized membrane protein YkvI
MGLASRFGLVALIANGYRVLAYILLATYILPLVTIGVWKLWRMERLAAEREPPFCPSIDPQE